MTLRFYQKERLEIIQPGKGLNPSSLMWFLILNSDGDGPHLDSKYKDQFLFVHKSNTQRIQDKKIVKIPSPVAALFLIVILCHRPLKVGLVSQRQWMLSEVTKWTNTLYDVIILTGKSNLGKKRVRVGKIYIPFRAYLTYFWPKSDMRKPTVNMMNWLRSHPRYVHTIPQTRF